MRNDPKEKKFGRAVIEAMNEIRTVPRNNVRHFLVAQRNLKRAVKAYTDYTGSEYLLHKSPAYYGFDVMKNKSELALEEAEKEKRRHGTEPE